MSAARRELAPPGAVELRLCRYASLNAHPSLGLTGSRLVENITQIHSLLSGFDRLPAMRRGIFCPMDDGSQILAVLSYSEGELRISVRLTGCELVTNGSVHRTVAGFPPQPTAGPRLVEQLEQLLRG